MTSVARETMQRTLQRIAEMTEEERSNWTYCRECGGTMHCDEVGPDLQCLYCWDMRQREYGE